MQLHELFRQRMCVLHTPPVCLIFRRFAFPHSLPLPAMPRLFVAIDVADSWRPLLAALRDEALPARWVPSDQYHLTLRFIGDVPPAQADEITAALADVRGRTLPLEANGLGVFPSRRNPRVLYAGLNPVPALTHLQQAIEAAVVRAGLPAETRPFSPHVTVALLKGARPQAVRTLLKGHSALQLPPFEADTFHLYESMLHAEGTEHRRRATFALGRR